MNNTALKPTEKPAEVPTETLYCSLIIISDTLQLKQALLGIHAIGEAGEFATCADDAVARDDEE